MARPWVTLALRAAYAAAAAWATMESARVILAYAAERGLPVAPLALAPQALAVVSALHPRLYAVPLVLAVAAILLAAPPSWAAWIIAVAALAGAASMKRWGGARLASLSGAAAGLLASAAVYAAIAGLLGAAGYVAYRAAYTIPPLSGEAYTVASVLHSTLLYRLLAAGLVLGVAFKAVYHLVELALAASYSPGMARAAVGFELEQDERGLLGFRGRQYPTLESTLSWLLAVLAAPTVYDTVNAALTRALGGVLEPLYTAMAATVLSILAWWIVLRGLTAALVRPPGVEALLEPRLRVPLLLGLIASTGILAVVLAAGGDPLAVLRAAATGEPQPAPDPLEGVLAEAPGEDYYRSLARLLDLIVRLFWGG